VIWGGGLKRFEIQVLERKLRMLTAKAGAGKRRKEESEGEKEEEIEEETPKGKKKGTRKVVKEVPVSV